jgi:hypothetical protein
MDGLEDAVSEALAEVGGEAVPDEQVEEPAVETPDEPVQEETKEETAVEEEAPEEEEPLGLSAEQLALINQNPELQAAYKSMQAGLTKKFQEAAEVRKTSEKATQVAEWIEKDPDAAIKALAEARGIKLQQEPAKTVEEAKAIESADELTQKWAKALGSEEAANVFKPLLEEHMKSFVEQFMTPLQQQQEQLQQQAQARGIASAISEFEAAVTARGEAMDQDIKTAMSEKMKALQPSDDATIDQYLGELYNAVMYDRYRTGQVQKELKRLQKSKASSEPTRAAVAAPKAAPNKITVDMSEDDALKAALALAEAELSE